MTLVLTMLAVLAGFFALMLALDPRRRKRAAYGATVALTAGAFGLADNIPTVGGDALAQPGCHWDAMSTTLSCTVMDSVPEFAPSFDCVYCRSGYGEGEWGHLAAEAVWGTFPTQPLVAMPPPPPPPPPDPDPKPGFACAMTTVAGMISFQTGLYTFFTPEPVVTKIYSGLAFATGTFATFGGMILC